MTKRAAVHTPALHWRYPTTRQEACTYAVALASHTHCFGSGFWVRPRVSNNRPLSHIHTRGDMASRPRHARRR
ncbi:MAG: CRISPR-associated protein Cas5 [Ardenticatenia bacterium]|nr:MAG: CRISPR-associated protein Cas5 [Ardenticatenia bacterium]